MRQLIFETLTQAFDRGALIEVVFTRRVKQMSQPTRRKFIGTGLGGALALLATKGFAVTEVKEEKGRMVTIAGVTSTSGLTAHVHSFEATLNLDTGDFSGTTTATINVDGSDPFPHTHDIAGTLGDAFDFDAMVESSPTGGHTHQARPN